MNAAPYEVVMGPGEGWITDDLDAEFPKVDETPDPGVWKKIGKRGNRTYLEDGVTVRKLQTTATFTGLGAIAPTKAIRSSVGLQVDIPVADISPDTLALIHNGNSVSTVPAGGDAGYKVIDGYVSPDVKVLKMLVRGPSPESATGYGQFEIQRVFESSDSSEMTYRKDGTPVAINLQFTAMENLDAETDADRFYQFRAMTAPASS